MATSNMDIDQTLPEPVRQFLMSGGTLERIALDEEGRWTHQGEPFENEHLRALFHRSIERTGGGTWVLHIGPFIYPIEVADTPYHVRRLRLLGEGVDERAELGLSDGTEEVLDPLTLRYRADPPALYCGVKGGAHQARFNRAAYDELLQRLEEHHGQYGVRIAGHCIDLQRAD